MDICLERSADLHTAQLMPLPLTVSCLRKIQIGFTFLVLVVPDKGPLSGCVCVCISVLLAVIDPFMYVAFSVLSGGSVDVAWWFCCFERSGVDL